MALNPFKNRKLLKDGRRGTATVLEIDETALTRHRIESTERVSMSLKLQVEVEGEQPYEISGKFWVRPEALRGAGDRVPVAVDPKNRENLAIDWRAARGGRGGIDIDIG